MAKSNKKAVASAASATILVAVGELKGGGIRVEDGQELTAELQDEMGLDADTITALVERGIVAEVKVRAAEAGDSRAVAALQEELAAETKRADDAEAKVKELEDKLTAPNSSSGKPTQGAAQ